MPAFAKITAALFLVLLLTGRLTFALSPEPEMPGTPDLRIQNRVIEVTNNSSHQHRFVLSVLGLQETAGFVPFLAIAVDPSGPGPNRWMAVWNLGIGRVGFGSQVKALIPYVWGARGGKGAGQSDDDDLSGIPGPVLTWDSFNARSWVELGWDSAKTATRFMGFFNPGRFFFGNYAHYREDTAERRFYQTYTLLRLYEEAQALYPAPGNLSMHGITDLKYRLITGRKGLGVFASNEAAVAVVSRFESALRQSVGLASCYAHDEANQLYLTFEEVPFGLPGRPPVGRAGLLSIRKSDLPEKLPEWPLNNLFDLSSSPYSDPLVADLMNRNPEEAIPLGIYVFGSDLRSKPVLLVDFFHPDNPKKRNATGALKVALDNWLSVRGIPWFGRMLKGAIEYGVDRKDFSYFNLSSRARGVESARLFAKMGWNFDPDINHLMLRSIESSVGNPMLESADLGRRNLDENFRGLMAADCAELGLFLRKLLEDRVRRTLNLGNRAVFAADLQRYEAAEEYAMALGDIKAFNREPHLPSIRWERLIEAWQLVDREGGSEAQQELRRLADRVAILYPETVPAAFRTAVSRLLGTEARASNGLGESTRMY